MILGTGVDILEIERLSAVFERQGEAFKRKVYTPEEQAQAATRGRQELAYYAGRWAAKEAVAKALGTGFGANCGWLEVMVLSDPTGRPTVALSGNAARTAERLGIARFHLSISHERSLAIAHVIAEA